MVTAAFITLGLSLSLACGSPHGSATTGVAANPTAQGAMDRVEIRASKYEFSPRELKINAGRPVTVVLTSIGGGHSFHIDALNVHSPEAEGGKSITFELKVERPGTYEFYCAHGDHKEKGMTGRLEVTP